MVLMEAVLGSAGVSIASAVLKSWLGADSLPASIASGAITKVIDAKVSDFFDRQEARRAHERLKEQAGRSIERVLRGAGSELPEERLAFLAKCVGRAVSEAALDLQLVLRSDLQPDRVLAEVMLRIERGSAGGVAANLSPRELEVYMTVVAHAGQLIVDVAKQLPEFESEYQAQLLERFSSIASSVVQEHERVIERQADAFEAEYRMACVRHYDVMELFGVRVPDRNRRYNLSVAYISLDVETIEQQDLERDDGQGGRGDGSNAVDRLESQADLSDPERVPNAAAKSAERDGLLGAEEVVAGCSRLLIRGPAGSGKTTLLQWLAVSMASRRLEGDLAALNDCVPLLIKLRALEPGESPGTEKCIEQVSSIIANRMPDRWELSRLDAGSAVLLIDGVDEIASGSRPALKAWLEEFCAVYPGVRVLVTSRPHAAEVGWLDALGFVDAEIQPMSRGAIKMFIEHWHEAIGRDVFDVDRKKALGDLASKFSRELASSPAIYRLATSPLLCALLCALHKEMERVLPKDKVGLYDACIGMFLRRDDARGIDRGDYPALSSDQIRVLASGLAWWMIRNGLTAASVDDAKGVLDSGVGRLHGQEASRANGERVLDLLIHRIGLVRAVSRDSIDFPHRSFQEFLAAHAASDANDLGLLVRNADDDQWREVVILSAGVLSSSRAEELVNLLLEAGDEDAARARALYLVAASALDVIVQLPEGSELVGAVERRMESIIPPRTISDGKLLAGAGDIVVPHLKRRRGMRAIEAAASVRALAMIGTDSAFRLLSEYAVDDRTTVQDQLVRSIAYTPDVDAYGAVALSHVGRLDLPSGRITVEQIGRNCPGLRSLRLTGSDVDSIRPLLACKELSSLELINTGVKDLGPIESMERLRRFSLVGGGVESLEPLSRQGSIKQLFVGNEAGVDLGPVRRMGGLIALRVVGSKCQRVDFLRGHPGLQTVGLLHCGVSELGDLSGATELASLHIDGATLDTVEPLGALPSLRHLGLNSNECSSLEGFDCMQKLKSLSLSGVGASEVGGLSACRGLRFLDISHSSVEDLRFLSSLPKLQFLDLSGLKVGSEELRWILGMGQLEHLALDGVAGLSAGQLVDCASLQWLSVAGWDRAALEGVQKLPSIRGVYVDPSVRGVRSLGPRWVDPGDLRTVLEAPYARMRSRRRRFWGMPI